MQVPAWWALVRALSMTRRRPPFLLYIHMVEKESKLSGLVLPGH